MGLSNRITPVWVTNGFDTRVTSLFPNGHRTDRHFLNLFSVENWKNAAIGRAWVSQADACVFNA